MKQALLFAAFIFVAYPGFARAVSSNQYSYQPESPNIDTGSVRLDIHAMLSEIMNVTGLQANFELRAAKVPNIQATILRKKRLILYNPIFINWVQRATNDKWGIIALLAHEVGHHLNGHTIRKTGSTPEIELQADEFSGFVLYKLGASLKQAQEVMNYIATARASETHPSRISRMNAIETGWSKAAKSFESYAGVRK